MDSQQRPVRRRARVPASRTTPVTASRAHGRPWHRAAFLVLAAFMLTPWASPPLALALGAAFALSLGNPFPELSARLSRWLLQACVVGLGFGLSLAVVVAAGTAGLGYTVLGIMATLALGTAFGRWLRVEGETSFLITAGTSICGGSAIAAVGPAIGATAGSMSVALATVFVLNAVALYLFPPIGHLAGLTQEQFAIWAAVAIHDTSSVVGAAAVYGSRALEYATVLKLARALWVLPLALGAALYTRSARLRTDTEGGSAVRIPWFIGLFLLAALLRTLAPLQLASAFDGVAHAARTGLVLTLFLIGAGLSRETLRHVGPRPFVQGLLLWMTIAGLSLLAVSRDLL